MGEHSQLQLRLVRAVAMAWTGASETDQWLDISMCRAGIRLAGATNDVHIMDFETGKWSKIEPLGDLPAPRAAHAAVAVGSMMVVQVHFLKAFLSHKHRISMYLGQSTCQFTHEM